MQLCVGNTESSVKAINGSLKKVWQTLERPGIPGWIEVPKPSLARHAEAAQKTPEADLGK